jgi:hypothetical protein
MSHAKKLQNVKKYENSAKKSRTSMSIRKYPHKKTETKINKSPPAKQIIIFVIIVTIFSVALFLHFRKKAAERRAYITAQYEHFLEEEKTKFQLSCKDLLPMKNGHYELYYVTEKETKLMAKFNIDEKGNFINTEGGELQQPLRAKDPQNFVLNAVSQNGESVLIMSGKPTLEIPYKNMVLKAEGSFTLATPTDDNPYNEGRGVWFGQKSSNAWLPSLHLPQPPQGWIYSAWLYTKGKILLIGNFISGDSEDLNKTYYTGKGPSVPGEDFFINLPDGLDITDIRANENSSIWVTLQPTWYTESYPFPFTILGAEITTSTQTNTPIPLKLAIESLPYCTISPISWTM